MLHLVRVFLLLALTWAAALILTMPARAQMEVDLALVLAVDISRSMEKDEQQLQRRGFVEAFRAPEVQEAIRKGMLGRIAVVYVEWSDATDQKVIVPWTVIEHPEEALGFAEQLAQSPTRIASSTSISGAIDFSVKLLAESDVTALRQVIDISGDGANNNGRTVVQARDEATARGITINGLPIMLMRSSGPWDTENLDLYFRDCVIGGPGAFMVPVQEQHQFIAAIKAKIIREISDQPMPQSLVQSAQTDPRANCLAGELKLRQRTGP
jgi:hypothetical protein